MTAVAVGTCEGPRPFDLPPAMVRSDRCASDRSRRESCNLLAKYIEMARPRPSSRSVAVASRCPGGTTELPIVGWMSRRSSIECRAMRQATTFMRAACTAFVLFSAACGSSHQEDTAEERTTEDALGETVANGRPVIGSSLLVGAFQVPFCAGGIPATFKNDARDMIGIAFDQDGTFRALVPRTNQGALCAATERCLGVEVGTWATRAGTIASGERLVLRPEAGPAREYGVTKSLTLGLSRPNTTLAPGAVAGTAGGGYPLSGLSAEICFECADTEERFRTEIDGKSTWRCRPRAGMKSTPSPRLAVRSATGRGVGSVPVTIRENGGPIASVRIQAEIKPNGADLSQTEFFLEHGGETVRIGRGRAATRTLTLDTRIDDFVGAASAGAWTLVAVPDRGNARPELDWTVSIAER